MYYVLTEVYVKVHVLIYLKMCIIKYINIFVYTQSIEINVIFFTIQIFLYFTNPSQQHTMEKNEKAFTKKLCNKKQSKLHMAEFPIP